MLLRDAHVEEPVREIAMEPFQTGAHLHGSRHSHHLRIAVSHFPHDGGKNIGPVRLHPLVLRKAGSDIKRLCTVESGRMALCRSITVSLLREDMKDHGSFDPLGFFQRPHHLADVVTVHGAQIGKTHIFKKHARNKQLLEAVLCLPNPADDLLSVDRDAIQGIRHRGLQVQITVRRTETAEIIGHAAHVLGNRHVVVVQNDDKIALQAGGVIHGLVGHSAGEGAVSDDGNHIVIPA